MRDHAGVDLVVECAVAIYLTVGVVIACLCGRRAGWRWNHWVTAILASPFVALEVVIEGWARRGRT